MAKFTFPNGMTVRQDWDRDGFLVIENAKTIDLYKSIKKEMEQYSDPCIFWAFDQRQFDEKSAIAKQHMKEGEELMNGPHGMICTQSALEKMSKFYSECDERIKNECDPQEVYCYEYNNYECCISWDGDLQPWGIVRSIWGDDVKIKRFK